MRFLVGVVVACAVTVGCSSNDGSESDGFRGVCLGAQRQFYDDQVYGDACGEHFDTPARCANVEGCEWVAEIFCRGFPRQCRTYGEGECSAEPGCKWYDASRCADEASCNVVMYVDEGACRLVPSSIVGTCSGSAYIDLRNICSGAAPREPLDCDAL